MGWASGSSLAENLWRGISPHIDIDQLQHVAQTIIDAFEDHDADDWDYEGDLYQTAYPFGEGKFAPLVKTFDDESARCTEKGSDTVKLMLQVSNKADCSILDVIACYVKDGNDDNDDMNAYCLNYLTGLDESSLESVYMEPATEYPPETDENELFYSYVLLCAYGFGHAFQEGGEFAGRSFRDFLAERPEVE
jgi:hypothetical protein